MTFMSNYAIHVKSCHLFKIMPFVPNHDIHVNSYQIMSFMSKHVIDVKSCHLCQILSPMSLVIGIFRKFSKVGGRESNMSS
jgi:hypothetical protein